MIETVAVLMPTKGRTEQMSRNVAGLLACDVPEGYELLVLIAYEESDTETAAAVYALCASDKIVPVIRPDGLTAVEAWNLAARYLTFIDWYILGADDIVWHSDWLKEAMLVIDQTGAQVIGLNDGGHTDLNDYAPHYMVHRNFLHAHQSGYMVPPEYKSWWFDREICQRARALGLYAPAWKAMAEHQHPDWGTAQMDETYRQALTLHDVDGKLYRQRMGL